MIKFIIWRKGATSGLRIWRRHCYGKGSTPGAHAKGTAKKKKREPHSLQRKCWPELVQPMGKCQPRIRYLLGPSKSLLWFLFFSCKRSWFWPQVNLGKGLSNLPAWDESLSFISSLPPLLLFREWPSLPPLSARPCFSLSSTFLLCLSSSSSLFFLKIVNGRKLIVTNSEKKGNNSATWWKNYMGVRVCTHTHTHVYVFLKTFWCTDFSFLPSLPFFTFYFLRPTL